MAQKTDIRLRRSNTANAIPTHSNLSDGEMAMNTMDGALYFKKSDNTIITAVDNTIMHLDSSTNRVGIGTTSPAKELDVFGTVRAHDSNSAQHQLRPTGLVTYGTNLRLNAQASGLDIEFQTQGTTHMTILDSGNVGIGTTSPTRNLHIHEGDSTLAYIQITNDTTGSTSLDGVSFGITGDENAVWINRENKDSLISTNNTERLRIKADGKVGIGESTPDRKLHVKDSNYRVAVFERTGAPNSFITFTDPNTTQDVAIGATTNDLMFRSGNVTHLSLLGSNGHLKFTDFDQELEFGSTSNKLGYSLWLMSASAGGQIKNVAGPLTLNPDDFTAFQVNDVEKARINTTGLGIGTDSPNQKLEIKTTSGTAGLRIHADHTNSPRTALEFMRGTSDTFGGDAFTDWKIGHVGNDQADFAIISHDSNRGENERVTVEYTTGNVGIGTTSPQSQLDVASGTIRARGLSTIGSGAGTELRYISGDNAGGIIVFDRSTSTYEELRLEGSVIKLKEAGVDVLTVDGGNATLTGNLIFDDGQITSDGTNFIFDGAPAKEVIISSARDVRIIIDDNNDDTNNEFQIFRHSGSGTKLLNLTQAGALTINEAYTFPTSDGTAGQVLKTNGSGVLSFADDTGGGGSSASLTDADADTKIQLEEGTDDDIIRFDTAGSQRMAILANGNVGIGTSSPRHKLSVNGTLGSSTFSGFGLGVVGGIATAESGTTNAAIGLQCTSASASKIFAYDYAGSAGIPISIQPDNANVYICAGGGNVGITTTSPNAKLHIVNNSTSLDSILLESSEDSSSAAPILAFKRNSASVADADYLGQLKFKGENDADQEVVYAKITAKIQDATDGTEDGLLEFANRKAGSNNIGMRLRSDSLQLLNDTNFVVGDITMSGSTVSDAGDFDLDIGGDITLDAGGGDIRLKDDGTQFGRLANFLGSLVITSSATDTAMMIGNTDGSVIMGGHVTLGDNNKSKYGDELEIYTNGTNAYIDEVGGGNLFIRSDEIRLNKYTGEFMVRAIADGAVTLYYDNSAKFATTSAGAAVTGDLTISGDLTINGTTTTVSSTNTAITDALIELGSGNTGANTNDLGLILERGTTGNNAFIGWQEANDRFIVGTTTATGATTGAVSLSRANMAVAKLIMSSDLEMVQDNIKIKLGAATDLEIYHDSTNSHILNKTGDLVIKNTLDDIKILAEDDVVIGDDNDTTRFATFINGGAVNLFHNGTARLSTTSSGASITGNITLTNAIPKITFTDSDTSTDASISANSSHLTYTTAAASRDHIFKQDTTERMRITDVGVGIGTTAPATALHVNGEITIPASIVHEGDSDTFFGFHTNNQWRVVTGGTERIEVRDSEIVINDGSNDYNFRVESDGDSNCLFVDGGLNRVGIGTNSPGAKLQVEEYGIETTETSTSATTEVAVASMSATTFRSARFTIQITNSTDSTYHTTELLALHDGSTANITEFGTIFTGAAVEATFDADISSGNFRLLATPSSTDSMVFKVVSHSINV